MNKRTKALSITKAVKDIVWERDSHQCIICGNAYAQPNAHYISRAQGGLGIEQNIVTLCANCHRRYDQSTLRTPLRRFISAYLESCYEDWDEQSLVYRKE